MVRLTSSRGTQLLEEAGAQRSDELEAAHDDGSSPGPPAHSRCSKLTFQHFQEVMTKGRARPLQRDDLPPLPRDERAHEIAVLFAANLRRRGTVARALISTFWRPFAVAGLWKLPQDCCVFVGPFLLKVLIPMIESETPSVRDGLLLVGAILLAGLVQTVCLQQYFVGAYRVSYCSMAAMNMAIYDKSLVLSNASRGKHSVGETVNLVSVDVETIAMLFAYVQVRRDHLVHRISARWTYDGGHSPCRRTCCGRRISRSPSRS